MKLTERHVCEVTGVGDLEPLHTFPDFPVFMGCSDQAPELDLRQEMSWWISKGSGLIQLKKLLPLDVLYPESHGAGAVGKLWQEHHKSFAAFVNKAKPSSVFEIGGAHGILAREYQAIDSIPWTIIEPNPSPVEGCKAQFIRGFFDDEFSWCEDVDTVVHSHVFEHIYKPDRFMQRLSEFVPKNKKLIFSVPNMSVMLERKYTNCINFEHTNLLTEPYIEYFLAKHGFTIALKEYFLEDHSIFYSATRENRDRTHTLAENLYELNKGLYLDYVNFHEKLVTEINQKVVETSQTVFLFGAHVFSQYLIEIGLDTERIKCILDNDPMKQGRRLYGTSLKVFSPEVLRSEKNPLVILRAGVYNDEIKRAILENVNDSTSFID